MSGSAAFDTHRKGSSFLMIFVFIIPLNWALAKPKVHSVTVIPKPLRNGCRDVKLNRPPEDWVADGETGPKLANPSPCPVNFLYHKGKPTKISVLGCEINSIVIFEPLKCIVVRVCYWTHRHTRRKGGEHIVSIQLLESFSRPGWPACATSAGSSREAQGFAAHVPGLRERRQWTQPRRPRHRASVGQPRDVAHLSLEGAARCAIAPHCPADSEWVSGAGGRYTPWTSSIGWLGVWVGCVRLRNGYRRGGRHRRRSGRVPGKAACGNARHRRPLHAEPRLSSAGVLGACSSAINGHYRIPCGSVWVARRRYSPVPGGDFGHLHVGHSPAGGPAHSPAYPPSQPNRRLPSAGRAVAPRCGSLPQLLLAGAGAQPLLGGPLRVFISRYSSSH